MIVIPDCKVASAAGGVSLEPARGDDDGVRAFDRSVRAFLRENPDYEIFLPHRYPFSIEEVWDHVIIKLSA
ncbi:hypothetical protein ACSBOB_14775 [Mesorhizobium sp. ASY16-5R]|uniref:hypothetical protein n=1 Tax=Mesorhizobium sp. ASY16-5R TaxID=3445772 RepID=UPI003FA068EA